MKVFKPNHTKTANVSIFSIFTIRYDTRCYFNVRSKADISQLNLPHGSLIYRIMVYQVQY